MVKRMAGDTPEVLVLIDPMNVTGDYLTSATKGIDERGGPAVHFSFNSQGAQRFDKLTEPEPAESGDAGCVTGTWAFCSTRSWSTRPPFDRQFPIDGQISGGSMTDKEVELTVEVLERGQLAGGAQQDADQRRHHQPDARRRRPSQQGSRRSSRRWSGVVVFMLVYYRFAGVVACMALTLNLLMVLALMVLIKAAFTLPGLAGLVLTVGMSVDANVLIYERIREELKSGAALRMAIRNGFGRAMTAIIDTNLTTIISGIVLFYVGTDQVKGFAVTLILGILTNLFTAFFCSRVMFDVAERRGWIKELKMMHIFSEPNYDFLSIRWYALGASWALIAIGMVAVYFRGSQLLDIDFTGGSSVTFTLNDKDQMSLGRSPRRAVENRVGGQESVGRRAWHEQYRLHGRHERAIGRSREGGIQQGVWRQAEEVLGRVQRREAGEEPEFTGVEAKLVINAGDEYKGEQA